MLSGCTEYIHLPVDVTYEAVSAPYVLQVQNLTDTEITILPSDFGESKQFSERRLKPQEQFQIVLKVRRLRVGSDGTGLAANQVVPGPYIDASEEIEIALIETHHSDGDEYRIQIVLHSEDWLKPFSTGSSLTADATPQPPTLPIAITSFDNERWYPDGPKGPPQ